METERFLEIPGSNEPERFEHVIARVEPWLRRVIRLRLHGGRLRRLADTGDIFQSLMKDLVSREANRSPSVEDGPLLKPYLLGAIRNKIKARLRKERRNAGSLDDYPEPISAVPDPAHLVAEQEFVEAVKSRLTDEERRLLEFRRDGLTWPEVADTVGGQPDALRMRLRRSMAAAIVALDR